MVDRPGTVESRSSSGRCGDDIWTCVGLCSSHLSHHSSSHSLLNLSCGKIVNVLVVDEGKQTTLPLIPWTTLAAGASSNRRMMRHIGRLSISVAILLPAELVLTTF